MERDMYTTQELYEHAKVIFKMQPDLKPVSQLGVSCYHLTEFNTRQMHLFEEDFAKARRVADAADKLNDKYGEFTVIPGIMLDMDDLILDRISFGGVRDMEFHM